MLKVEFNQELLPEKLKQVISDAQWSENIIGCSSSRVFKLSFGWRNLYLKVVSANYKDEIYWEKEVLYWLKGKIPVPEILFCEEKDGVIYLLITEIKGMDAASPDLYNDKYGLIKLLAQGLKSIHSLDITHCKLCQNLDVKLRLAKGNIERGLVSEDDFNEENAQRTPNALYQQLIRERPQGEELVFVHGDYCVPNVIIDNNQVSGFIDFGRAGVADRYQDLALAARTIRYNFKEEKYVDMFFKEYGLDIVDTEKIDYYILLDELF